MEHGPVWLNINHMQRTLAMNTPPPRVDWTPDKVAVLEVCARGEISMCEAGRRLGVDASTVKNQILRRCLRT